MAIDGYDSEAGRQQTGLGTTVESSSTQLRPGVKAFIRGGRRVLLVQEAHRNGDPFWTLPGGGVRPDERPRVALRRELAEELGCEASVGDAVGTCRYRHRSDPTTVSIYVVFSATLESGFTPNHRHGILETTWTHPEDPPNDLLPEFGARLTRFCDRTSNRRAEPSSGARS